MRKSRSVVALFTFILISATALSQTNDLKFIPFKLDKTNPQKFLFSRATAILCNEPNTFISQNNSLKPFDSGVHYSAFFCKMELKAVNHCNVWIKVHAGDYDRYAFANDPQ